MATARVGGIDLHYETQGRGPTLLLLHGLGSSGRDWEKQVPRFVDRYRVVTPDLRGHGRSAKPPGPYGVAGFAADVAGLLRGEELAPAHVAGISLGGMVALELALSRPELVSSLTLINTPFHTRLDTFRRWWIFTSRVAIVRLAGVGAMARVLARKLFPDPDQEELRRVFVERWRENEQAPYLASLRAIPGWSAVERLDELHCPTLVVSSEHDYSPPAEQRRLAAKIPDARFVVVAGARHAVPAEKPDEVNETLAEFLDGRAAGGGGRGSS
ncbi:MAG: alpha/beta hydrolase [Thermoanaerobaculia bacterium]|nr:alpha/beta hydrolase [Thermoanaerobaculia bacterium]